MNGVKSTCMVLSLALKMCAEQDTGLLLRPRRRRRTEFFQRLGRRACREAIVGLVSGHYSILQ